MQHSVLESLDHTAPLFTPSRERAASAGGTRVLNVGERELDPTLTASIHADSMPISERFCGGLALSALLAFGSAPLLAHAATVDSPTLVLCGLCSVVGALVIQVSERRRAVIRLTQAALARGLDGEAARRQARATLKLWLS